MADLLPTDVLLVNRAGVDHSIVHSDVMANVLDTDLLLVNRAGVDYQASYADVKKGFGPQHINPAPSDWTFAPGIVSGTGTQADPFIITPETVKAPGGTVQSAQTLTLTGQKPNDLVEWTDHSTGTGARFHQDLGLVPTGGQVDLRLKYLDTPNSTVGAAFTGDLQIGTSYFRWVVTQQAKVAPVIGSVVLADSPEAARFTSGTFASAVTMTEDGLPVSTKGLKAWVEGALKSAAQTSGITKATLTPPVTVPVSTADFYVYKLDFTALADGFINEIKVKNTPNAVFTSMVLLEILKNGAELKQAITTSGGVGNDPPNDFWVLSFNSRINQSPRQGNGHPGAVLSSASYPNSAGFPEVFVANSASYALGAPCSNAASGTSGSVFFTGFSYSAGDKFSFYIRSYALKTENASYFTLLGGPLTSSTDVLAELNPFGTTITTAVGSLDLEFTDNTSLVSFAAGEAVTEVGNGDDGTGVVSAVNAAAVPPTMKLSAPGGTWDVGSAVKGPLKVNMVTVTPKTSAITNVAGTSAWNQSQVWSNGASGSFETSGPATNAFDGSSKFAEPTASGSFTVTFTPALTGTIELLSARTVSVTNGIVLNGTTNFAPTADTPSRMVWDNITSASGGSLNSITVSRSGTFGGILAGIKVDGKILADTGVSGAPTIPLLTLTDTTDLANFSVGDVVQQVRLNTPAGFAIAKNTVGTTVNYPDTSAGDTVQIAASATFNMATTAEQAIPDQPSSVLSEDSQLVFDLISSSADFEFSLSNAGWRVSGSLDGINWVPGSLVTVTSLTSIRSLLAPAVATARYVMISFAPASNTWGSTYGGKIKFSQAYIDAFNSPHSPATIPGITTSLVKVTAITPATPSITVDGGSWSGTDGTSSGTLADRETFVTGPTKTTPAANVKLFCKLDAAGAVSDLQSADPGYVIMAGNSPYTLTWPATMPTGNAPDVDLPAGTTLTTEIQATSTGSTAVTKTSNIITPA